MTKPMDTLPSQSRSIRSRVTAAGTVEVTIDELDLPAPGPDDVVVEVGAAAINPSDVRLMFATADLSKLSAEEVDGRPVVTAPLSEAGIRMTAARVEQPIAAGNEAAGRVIAAGASDAAQALVGKLVGVYGGGMYTQHRVLPAAACQPFPDGVTAEQGASWFVNPMTAQAMLATVKDEGHAGLVHAPAASAVGKMLIRLCQADGIPLVNIVRRAEQAADLRALGAEFVCDSSAARFRNDLEDAIAATRATAAFDAIGGGELTNQILDAMETALTRGEPFNSYGSPTYKHAFLYGNLDGGPTELRRSYGTEWDVGGWLVLRRIERLGADAAAAMRARAADEIATTFATSFSTQIGLEQALDPDTIRAYGQMSTNGKHLIDPSA